MANLNGLFRITRDTEIRYLPDGKAVATLTMAYNYGTKKNSDGYLPSQFIEAELWERRAESLTQYLTRGVKIFCSIEDPHIETYQRQDGSSGFKMTGRVGALEFAGGGQSEQQAQSPAPAPTTRQQSAPPRQQRAPAPSGGVDDLEDQIPF